MPLIVGSRIEVPCAIRVLEVLKVFSDRFEDAESNERGLTSGKCGELSLESVFQNGSQNTLNQAPDSETSLMPVFFSFASFRPSGATRQQLGFWI